MSDPVLRELTASEPLTLDEEYSMQSEFPYHKLYQLGKHPFRILIGILSVEKWQDDPDSN
jgi:hypothetical protein